MRRADLVRQESARSSGIRAGAIGAANADLALTSTRTGGAQMADADSTPHMSFGDPRLPERFWTKVELIPFSTCWYWNASLESGGYAQISIGGRLKMAQKVAWEAL